MLKCFTCSELNMEKNVFISLFFYTTCHICLLILPSSSAVISSNIYMLIFHFPDPS